MSKHIVVRRVSLLLLGLGVVFLGTNQIGIAQRADASGILGQIAGAFSAGKPVTHIELTGSADWHAGGLNDSGNVTLTASSTGAASMQLFLAEKGSWTESQSDLADSMSCQWAGKDQVAHQTNFLNCLKPAVWFLPLISLQPTILPRGVGISDMGLWTVGAGTYRHLQIQAVLSSLPQKILRSSVEASTIDMGLDSHTLLVEVLRYQVNPENGSPVKIPIEVRYADYHKVDGVEIPFLIQRYVNGSLQLEIHVDSARIG
jgi:hypothetical protein